jgi:hypothetical protein
MGSLQFDTSQLFPTLIGDGIAILLTIFGWVGSRIRGARIITLVLSVGALALTSLGLFYVTKGFALGTGESDSGFGVVIAGVLLQSVGVPLAFVVCGSTLGQAQRSGRRRWFVVLLITALLPLLATVGFLDYLVLVTLPLYPGQPEVFSGELLVFRTAPVGCVAPLIYSLVILFGPREPRPAIQ